MLLLILALGIEIFVSVRTQSKFSMFIFQLRCGSSVSFIKLPKFLLMGFLHYSDFRFVTLVAVSLCYFKFLNLQNHRLITLVAVLFCCFEFLNFQNRRRAILGLLLCYFQLLLKKLVVIIFSGHVLSIEIKQPYSNTTIDWKYVPNDGCYCQKFHNFPK